MSDKIREEIAKAVGTSVDNIEESHGRYFVLFRIGKEGVIGRKCPVWYKDTREAEGRRYEWRS